MVARTAPEGVVAYWQGLGFLFEFRQPRCQIAVRAGHRQHAQESAHDLDVHGDGGRAT